MLGLRATGANNATTTETKTSIALYSVDIFMKAIAVAYMTWPFGVKSPRSHSTDFGAVKRT